MRLASPQKTLIEFAAEHGLHDTTVVVGVSGGPDSVCLLHLLNSAKDALRLQLHVAHLDHGLRGRESRGDALYVSRLAKSLRLPFTIERRDVKGFQRQWRCSLEEAAREVRYGFLSETAGRVSASCVVVGHTADDQVETILMHLIRGAGTRGLRGLRPEMVWRSRYGEESLRIVRPLLEVSREQTLAYCQAQGLSPRLDSSNESPLFLRNRIRKELLPLLQQFNADFSGGLLRLAAIAADDYAFVEECALAQRDSVSVPDKGMISFDLRRFSGLSPALQRVILYSSLEKLLGSPLDIEWGHIEDMLSGLRKAPGTRLSLPGGLTLYREYDRALLAPADARPCPLPPLSRQKKLKVPGETFLPGWRVVSSISTTERGSRNDSPRTAYLAADALGTDLVVRGRKPGDVFQPFGMDGSKKLQDFMVDARIPRSWRDSVPLVCSTAGLVWVVGYRIAEIARITGKTKEVLRLEFVQQDTRPAPKRRS